MKTLNYLAIGLLAIGTWASPAASRRPVGGYTSLTVFGDSLTDAGNYLQQTGGRFPDRPDGYFKGRFTNGYDFTDLLSLKLFGTPTVASRSGGANYAVGDARVRDAARQIAQYQQDLSAKSGHLDGGGLYVLEFGANDISYADTLGAVDRDAYLHVVARKYSEVVKRLSDLGARNILLTGFASVLSPSGSLAYGYLRRDVAALPLATDTRLLQYDMSAFLHVALTDPAKVGLPPLQSRTTCVADHAQPNCAGHLWFDATHPTAVVQGALLDDMNRKLSLVGSERDMQTWGLRQIGFRPGDAAHLAR